MYKSICNHCLQGKPLNKDGTLRSHKPKSGGYDCKGSHTKDFKTKPILD